MRVSFFINYYYFCFFHSINFFKLIILLQVRDWEEKHFLYGSYTRERRRGLLLSGEGRKEGRNISVYSNSYLKQVPLGYFKYEQLSECFKDCLKVLPVQSHRFFIVLKRRSLLHILTFVLLVVLFMCRPEDTKFLCFRCVLTYPALDGKI